MSSAKSQVRTPRRTRQTLKRTAGLTVGTLVALPAIGALTGLAYAGTSTIPLHQGQAPVTDSGFPGHESCAFPGVDAQPTNYGWHFVIPGNGGTFTSVTAVFASAGSVTLDSS